MLVVAGIIEAFVSPRRLPETTRIAVGMATAIVMILYLLNFAGTRVDRGA